MPPLLSACLIVRDEEARLPRCLAALRDLVDEVVVLDTGSRDGTVAVARAAGAVLGHRAWDDDFAAARQAALALASGTWVLSVDADEVVTADAAALRAALRAGAVPDGALVRVVHRADDGGDHAVTAVKLFRREGARWAGRVHERVVLPASAPVGPCPVPVVVDHDGYTGGGLARKAERNLRVARAALAAEQDTAERERLALEVGRALLGLGRYAEAADALAAVTATPGRTGLAARTHRARALLALGDGAAALAEVARLRATAAPERCVDLLEGEARLHAGDPAGAVRLLAPLAGGPPPVDVEDRTSPAGSTEVLLALAYALLEQPAAAADALLTAVRQGADPAVELHLLRSSWERAGREPAALAAALPGDALRRLRTAAAADVDVAVAAGPLLVAAGLPGPLTARCRDSGLGVGARLQAGLLALLADEPDPADTLPGLLVALAVAVDDELVAVLADDLAARHPHGAAALDSALQAAGRHPSGGLKTAEDSR